MTIVINQFFTSMVECGLKMGKPLGKCFYYDIMGFMRWCFLKKRPPLSEYFQ